MKSSPGAPPGGPDCPDLEDLATLLEGKLNAGKRTAIIKHLVLCRKCYFVLSGTLAWLDGETPGVEEESP